MADRSTGIRYVKGIGEQRAKAPNEFRPETLRVFTARVPRIRKQAPLDHPGKVGAVA